MPFLKRILSFSKTNSQPTASALRTSSAFPASGLPSVANSQGASQAAAELSETLGPALEQIDLDGDVKAQIGLFLDQLDQEASKYANSQLNHELYPEWDCAEADARLISTAFQGAQSVYNIPATEDSSTNLADTVQRRTVPSVAGTIKASTFTRITTEHGTVLVIAIRGSASVVDHVVNANYKPANAHHFIDIARSNPQLWAGVTLEAHAGFLKSAEALAPVVSEEISKYIGQHGEKSHVLFTGHSAGGAVASLLFLRHICSQPLNQSTRFSCITFGAPPVVTLPIPIDSNYLCLNIINEFDLVSRADGAYKNCLVDLAQSMYGEPTTTKPVWSFDTDISSHEDEPWQEKAIWPTSSSCYSHVGARIVFSMRPDVALPGSLRLHAIEVPQEDFERLLFCRISVHKRVCYAQRVELFMERKLNQQTEN
ncbi:Alpha/Beta hydrolase protein [Aspergillus californicus]